MIIGKKGQESDQRILPETLISLLLKIVIGIALLASIYFIGRSIFQ